MFPGGEKGFWELKNESGLTRSNYKGKVTINGDKEDEQQQESR